MNVDLLTINYAATLGIFFMLVFLWNNGQIERSTKNRFYFLIGLEFIEMIAYSAELVMASYSRPTIWRILLSILGYSIRPLLLNIILMISLRNKLNEKRKRLLFIPTILNMVIVCTALFSDLAFGYTENNEFYRGIFGFFPHLCVAFYLLVLVIFTIRNSLKRKTFEQAIIYLMSFVILSSVVIEAAFSVRSLGRTSTVMCTIFYFMYFQTLEYKQELEKGDLQIKGLSKKVNYDSMTKLLNKEAFRNACLESFAKNPTDSVVFVFLDLDHFKQLNDTLGHLTGDVAIIDTAKQLRTAFQTDDLVGRFGGDEFCACLRKISFEDLKMKLDYVCKIVRQEYWDDSHTKNVCVTCSIGAVYRDDCTSVEYEKMIVAADQAVYKAKETGRDRAVIEKL